MVAENIEEEWFMVGSVGCCGGIQGRVGSWLDGGWVVKGSIGGVVGRLRKVAGVAGWFMGLHGKSDGGDGEPLIDVDG